MEQLNETEYNGISRYLEIGNIESYEKLGSKFLELDENDGEVRYPNETIVTVCIVKFSGSFSELYKFIKENSRVVRVATTSGTLKYEGTVSMELDDNEEDGLDWCEYVDGLEWFDNGNYSYEFEEDGYETEISTKIKMVNFNDYEKSLSTPELKEVA